MAVQVTRHDSAESLPIITNTQNLILYPITSSTSSFPPEIKMPISEFIIATLKSPVAKAALTHIRTASPPIFSAVKGSLHSSSGHILTHNGQDISSEHKPLLALGNAPHTRQHPDSASNQ